MKTSRLFFLLLYILILFLLPHYFFSQSGWVQQNSGTTNNLRSVTFVNLNTGYVLKSPVLRTTNGGLNWITILPSLPFTKACWTDENTAYGPVGTVYKTTDAGFNWTDLNASLIKNVSFGNSMTGYAICNPEDYVEYSYVNVKKTLNGGLGWNTIDQYYAHWPNYVSLNDIIALNEQVVYYTVFGEDMLEHIIWSRVYKSINGGSNFNMIKESTDTVKFISLIFPSIDTGYVTAGYLTYPTMYHLFRVINNVWSVVFASNTAIGPVVFPNTTTGYLVVNANNIYKTTNAGGNWTLLNSGTNTTLYGLYFNNPATGYAVGDNGVILKTTTGGETPDLNSVSGTVKYQDNNQPVTSGYVKALRFDSLSHNIITVDSAQIQPNGAYTLPHCPPVILDIMAYENDEEELSFVPTYYVSTINWQNSTHVKPDSNLVNIDIAVKRIVNPGDSMHISGYVYTNNSSDYNSLKDAVIYARASGTFKSHSISLSNGYYKVDSLPAGVYELIVDRMGYEEDLFILSLTNSSLNNINFYLQDAIVPVNIVNGEVPESFMLEQNYPNPFNPVTNIQFSIVSPTFAKLIIYDILGREVKVLLSEKLSAGTYKSVWSASNYPSGVYFYRLETGDFTASKKMLLLK